MLGLRTCAGAPLLLLDGPAPESESPGTDEPAGAMTVTLARQQETARKLRVQPF